MKVSQIVRRATIGALFGLVAFGFVATNLEPETSLYARRRNGAGIGDAAIVLGFPTAFAVIPWFIDDDDALSEGPTTHKALVALLLTLTINGAAWGLVVGAGGAALRQAFRTRPSRPSA